MHTILQYWYIAPLIAISICGIAIIDSVVYVARQNRDIDKDWPM